MLNIVRHEIELVCSADAIPDQLTVDLDGLEIGDSVHIEAVAMPEGVRPVHGLDRDSTIAAIAAPRRCAKRRRLRRAATAAAAAARQQARPRQARPAARAGAHRPPGGEGAPRSKQAPMRLVVGLGNPGLRYAQATATISASWRWTRSPAATAFPAFRDRFNGELSEARHRRRASGCC